MILIGLLKKFSWPVSLFQDFIYSSVCPLNIDLLWTHCMAQTVKRLPAVRETWVQSLGWEDPLEKQMATHSSTLAWRIPWMEEPGGLQSMGSQRVGHHWATSLSLELWLDFNKHTEHDLKNECGCKESISVWWGSKDPPARNCWAFQGLRELVGQQLGEQGEHSEELIREN